MRIQQGTLELNLDFYHEADFLVDTDNMVWMTLISFASGLPITLL